VAGNGSQRLPQNLGKELNCGSPAVVFPKMGRKIRGFASPPLGGFALIAARIEKNKD
jgi:hypothetical protein